LGLELALDDQMLSQALRVLLDDIYNSVVDSWGEPQHSRGSVVSSWHVSWKGSWSFGQWSAQPRRRRMRI